MTDTYKRLARPVLRWGTGTFKIMIGQQILTFSHWDQIPKEYDEIIKFAPIIPPDPHTPEQHEQIHTLRDTFVEFMNKRRSNYARGNSNR